MFQNDEMSYQFSRNLGELIGKLEDDTPIALNVLAEQLASLFPKNSETVRSLLLRVTGTMPPGTLIRHLSDGISYDSVVRDVMTTGHLGKFLSRLDVLAAVPNPAIIGLPNAVFDQQSQSERAEFFAAGNILPIDAEILENNVIEQMLQREENPPAVPDKE